MIELTQRDNDRRILVNPAQVVWAKPMDGGRCDLLLQHATAGRIEVRESYEQVRAMLAGGPAAARVEHRVQLEGGEDASGNVYGGYLTLRIIDTGIVLIHETDEGEVTAALGKEWDELREELRNCTARQTAPSVLGPFDTHIQAAVYKDGPTDPGPFDSIVCHEPPPRPGDPPYQASTVM